jgi:catechol 2,3-dioxygenase-like lactoylglutathione lyase family enzyme
VKVHAANETRTFMIEGARYAHTNLIARDWRMLAAFYVENFGCSLVPPERNFSGPELEAGTGIAGAMLSGAHLRLPGYGDEGPTLEVFTYSELAESLVPRVNRPGYGHLAFQVNSVADARRKVLAAGGGYVGEIVTLITATGARVTWCYVTDPEGNIIELQSWWPVQTL